MQERQASDLYDRAEEQLTAVATAVQRQEGIDPDALSNLARAISDSIACDDQLVVQALAGPSGSTLVTNLINVSILATKVGAGLGYYGEELRRLTLAGLVHDIGLFAVPQSIVTKTGRLTPEERTLIEQHPELGYQVVRKFGPNWEWLADIVRQAHERWNGLGYPNRLTGREIHELALIIGAVDVFDALVTPRPYRRRFFSHEAVRELIVAERSAFPREIVKAVVEQLSAYPLGTLVRLTTGEVGTVVGINTKFPLRPIVRVGENTIQESDHEARQVDLSHFPLVSIVEAIEPPDVARVTFASGFSEGQQAKTIPSMSEQFSALLESLDALANAIQGVVETRVQARPKNVAGPQLVEEMAATARTASQETVDSSFEKEVIALFALEAHEWLAQIHSALKRLGEGADKTTRPRLYGIMLHGLTNLAKSAATVHLTPIENMATSLLPILHDIGRQEPHTMAAALESLQTGLDRIAAAVRGAEGIPAVEPSEHAVATEASCAVVEPGPTPKATPTKFPTPGPISVASGVSLLDALRDLQQVRSRSIQPARDVLEPVIQRGQEEPGVLSVAVVRRILDQLDRTDEEFVEEVRRRVPVITRALTRLREEGATDFITASQLDPVVQEVEALHDAAVSVQAGMITMFLQGLRSFLMVAAYRKTTTLSQRLSTVQSKIQALVPMAEQWVSIGRVERSAVVEILPPD